jgi:hypothetical protein
MDYSKQYYEKNRERIIEYNINYYWTHKSERQEYNKQYYIEKKKLRRRKPKITRKQKIMNIINSKCNLVTFN